ncbi:uncharacterized protein LOC116844530 isoform X2 [Odontomachus brunneus]|uniref:uncharacterized protein LOC116844530 isoform X2 n=1 Tax=Odontomachus brunneus TaxID=486640 RepID=UPI0013F2577B|nr:uncharacterized protein LOC116844530 isoform X2 [Odontomachus brunneus]
MSATKRNSTSSTTTTSSSKVCCFCNLADDNELDYGKLYDQYGIVTHYYCLLLSSNMEQKGNDDEGILGFLADDIQKELRRGKKLICSYCKRVGATLGCCNIKCKRIFHLPCGLKAGSLHQFFGQFKSFCVNHRPKQKIDEYIFKQINSSNDMLCYICYDRVNPKDLMETLWAPCCKKDAWFHRKCVQQLASSAGYFFKCPLCNNKKDFQNAMLQHGIFIPSQDASWELVPNAFEELLYRHDQCDATLCLCPKGRKHTSSNAKWELVLCRICGSQGIHMACGKLKWANPAWECEECTSILRNAKEHNSPRSGNSSDSSSLSRGSDSDESDSDISVGTDFPVLYSLSSPSSSSTLIEPSFKSRPGPRSFKLQQQLKACGITDSLLDTPCASVPTSTPTTKSTTDKVNKENDSAQESKVDDSRQTNEKDHYTEQKKSFDNNVKSQLNSNENIIITIESDDDDDVEIIALKRKINIPTVQIAWANMFRSSKSDNSGNSTENSADKSTKEIDPLQPDHEALKKCNNTKESNISTSNVSNRKKIDISKQSDVTASQDSTQKSTRQSTKGFTQELIRELTRTASLNDDAEVSEDSSSVMNIKITNVTSLPPEVFANVPDVDLEENVTWLQSDTGDTSSAEIKPLEKWVASQQSSSTAMKRGIHEEATNIADNNCKKIKGNSLDEMLTDTVMHDTWREQNQRVESKDTSNMEPSEIIEDIDEYTASITKISSPSLSTSQKNDITTLVQTDTCKVDVAYAVIESNHHLKTDDSVVEIASSQSSENDSVKLYTPVIQADDKQIYYSFPSSNIFYSQPVSSQGSLESESAATLYATTSNDVIRPPVIQNTANIRQTVVMAESISTDVITNDSQKAEVSSNQQAELLQEKTTDNPPTGSDSSSRIVCDGDAGRTNPAVTSTRPACFSEAAENAGAADTSNASEITGREVEQERNLPRFQGSRKTYNRRPHNESIRAKHGVFPRVTNNHNACHQPRLIPQYMHLHDLKFRVCGKNIQMTLYDTFSVNISVKNNIKNFTDLCKKATWKPRLFTSQARYEASSSSNHIDSDSLASRSTDNKTERTADATTIVAHDDTKENLDPVSRMVSCNVTSGNTSLTNVVDDAHATNDTNPNALGRAICNTSVGSKDNDRSQNLRIEHRESVQRKQPTPVTEESSWLTRKRTIHSIDSDLNIVQTNKNVEKVLQNNVTVAANRRIDNKGSDGSRAMNDSQTSPSRNLSYTTANHAKSSSYAHSDRTSVTRSRIWDRDIVSVPNIMFNERSISNKQIDACDSSQLIRCMDFREDERKCNDDSTIRVSIDLCKIQNVINPKLELLVSDEEDNNDNDVSDDNDNRLHRKSRLRGKDDYTQQQVKFRDSETNDSTKHYLLRNGKLQALGRINIDKNEARDSLHANANIFNRYRKRERESRCFDRHNR